MPDETVPPPSPIQLPTRDQLEQAVQAVQVQKVNAANACLEEVRATLARWQARVVVQRTETADPATGIVVVRMAWYLEVP